MSEIYYIVQAVATHYDGTQSTEWWANFSDSFEKAQKCYEDSCQEKYDELYLLDEHIKSMEIKFTKSDDDCGEIILHSCIREFD